MQVTMINDSVTMEGSAPPAGSQADKGEFDLAMAEMISLLLPVAPVSPQAQGSPGAGISTPAGEGGIMTVDQPVLSISLLEGALPPLAGIQVQPPVAGEAAGVSSGILQQSPILVEEMPLDLTVAPSPQQGQAQGELGIAPADQALVGVSPGYPAVLQVALQPSQPDGQAAEASQAPQTAAQTNPAAAQPVQQLPLGAEKVLDTNAKNVQVASTGVGATQTVTVSDPAEQSPAGAGVQAGLATGQSGSEPVPFVGVETGTPEMSPQEVKAGLAVNVKATVQDGKVSSTADASKPEGTDIAEVTGVSDQKNLVKAAVKTSESSLQNNNQNMSQPDAARPDSTQPGTVQLNTLPIAQAQTDGTKIVALPDLRDRLVQEIQNIYRISKGKPQAEVQLKLEPESLGQITIRLVFNKGEINAYFFTENSQVKDLLESSMQQLKLSLSQQDMSLKEALVFVGDGSQSDTGRFYKGYNGGEKAPYGWANRFGGEEAVLAQVAPITKDAANMVNYLV